MKNNKKLNIAIIGSGISGLGAAWLLSKKHNVTVYEAGSHFGGHANTVTAVTSDGNVPVDTGFIVCNDRNYPNFLTLMDKLNINPHPTEMSFAVSMDNHSFEYAGSQNLMSLIAQKRNLLRPRFWRMIKSIMRFYDESSKIDLGAAENQTLREYLELQQYDHTFLRDHILPMAAAVWSTPSSKVGDFPLASFLRFCTNHGLLQIKDRPQWFTIPGGSREYVNALMNDTDATFEKNSPVTEIKRVADGVSVKIDGKEAKHFDRILIATHADTALSILKDADALEQNILGAFKYATNRAVLHSDERFMPNRKGAWSSWNYLQNDSADDDSLSVTYWMNKLQPLKTNTPLFVTLNPSIEPKQELIHYSKEYAHPIFDLSTLNAQKKLMDIMGHRNVWYAGAHFGYGFHEDGLQSGLFAAEQLGGVCRPWNMKDMNGRIIALNAENTSIRQVQNHKKDAA
ncbi:NAD(P)/FAD-dependent oxidoreductase [Pseudemcibacter aquimaris]|uniref:NAD(P)/FAD-dependent oxidoreductase n=1 Tax=Pseudemcibacter aquimaris TaxID=2857064 RepID=UPI002012852F|nr:FAD-dependent oxidoreductase [Pseudemcibacter aquimaris]MCC3861182.1 FAD-dependent oxidoreductase [Pseudemcibacter aquimaris]WDU57957.1 FAD-dependent oxidoreductase [Pseudemcibacter aquimaris]